MEGFIVFIVVMCAIFSSVSKAKKTAQKQSQHAAQRATSQAARAPKPSASAQKPQVQQITFAEQIKKQSKAKSMQGSLGQAKPMESTEGMSGYQVMTHRLEPLDRRTAYTGSLGGVSTEGEDECDPSLGHGESAVAQISAVESAADTQPELSFNRQALLNGVVMNEILTRPAQRKWGRLYHG